MARIYYGYQMVDGEIVIQSEEAEQLKQLYHYYLLGESLSMAGRKAGIKKHHASLGRLLSQNIYTGQGVYQQIIDDETFYQVQEERAKRQHQLGRNFEIKEETCVIHQKFTQKQPARHYENPMIQASYLYSLIEVVS